jgi:hypothetical protein
MPEASRHELIFVLISAFHYYGTLKLNSPSTFHLEEAGHTAADQGIRPEVEDHPEEVAVGRIDPAGGIGLAVVLRTDLDPVEADHTVHLEEELRTGLEEVRRRTDLGVVLRIGLEEAAGRNLAEERRTGREERRSRQVRDGWSSRPWSRSCGR